MKLLRSVLGATRRVRLENEPIRESLGIFSLKRNVKEGREGWKKRVLRLKNERFQKHILCHRSTETTNVCTPKRR